jgi:hypothetical protein
MADLNAIIKSIRSASNKDSNAYKITEYYNDLTSGILDDGGIALVTSKILNIEKCLIKWVKEHPNNGETIMPPEESAISLINYLGKRGIFRNNYDSQITDNYQVEINKAIKLAKMLLKNRNSNILLTKNKIKLGI